MTGLRRVLIKGEPYPIFFGMYGFARIMQKTGLKLGQVQTKLAAMQDFNDITGDDLIFLYEFMHAGFEVGAQMEGEEFPHSAVQLSALIPLQGDAIETIFEAFAESMPQAAEADQKKARRKPRKVKAKKSA